MSVKDYFHFTLSERRGIVALLCAIVVVWAAPSIFSYFKKGEKTDYSAFQQEVEAFRGEENAMEQTTAPASSKTNALFAFDPNTATQAELQALGLSEKTSKTIVNYRSKGGKFFNKTDLKKIYTLSEDDYARLENYIQIEQNEKNTVAKTKNPPSDSVKYKLFAFNPNTATPSELLALGLPERVVQTISNFRSKGGTFREKQDLQKIYGLNPNDYQRLEPYINIEKQVVSQPVVATAQAFKPTVAPTPTPQSYSSNYTPKGKPTIQIDINAATIEDFEKLRGIGASYSKRIVNFREKLGGFHSINQVAETYNLPDSTFQAIKANLLIGAPVLKKINLNTADYATLNAHPYIDNAQANAIVNYRKMHGNYTSVDDLKKIQIIDAALFQKIAPYCGI